MAQINHVPVWPSDYRWLFILMGRNLIINSPGFDEISSDDNLPVRSIKREDI